MNTAFIGALTPRQNKELLPWTLGPSLEDDMEWVVRYRGKRTLCSGCPIGVGHDGGGGKDARSGSGMTVEGERTPACAGMTRGGKGHPHARA